MRLNLGCGFDNMEGWINCDKDKQVFPDKILDMEKPFKIKSNSIEEIYCSHTLEHIDRDALINVTLPEIWRVCMPFSLITIIVPYMDAQNVLNHKTRFNEDTFRNWCKETYNNSDSFPFKFSFKITKIKHGIQWFHRPLFWMPLKTWKGLFSYLIGEIRVEMMAIKK